MTLSYSRIKYVYFSVDLFDAKTIIDAHTNAFRYFGGIPQIIVYDQDKSMVVSENLGDTIIVKKFEVFMKEPCFSICLCIEYDPSINGIVEKQ